MTSWTPRLPLTTRAFLSFMLPVSILLVGFVFATHAAVQSQIRRELREQLQNSDAALNREQSIYTRRIAALASKMARDPGLQASVGLLSEVQSNPALLKQARSTIALELGDVKASSGFDLLAITDLNGSVISDVLCDTCRQEDIPVRFTLGPEVMEIGGQLYQLQSTPITAGPDQVAVLVLGTPFDLRNFAGGGEAVLLRDSAILASTLPLRSWQAARTSLNRDCAVSQKGCETAISGETFVVSELQKGQIGHRYRLFSLQSVDRPAGEFASGFLKVLGAIAAAGICLACAFTFLASRFLSRPLRALAAQLHSSESAGGMERYIDAGTSVRELASLANAYNRVVDSERQIRAQLESARDEAQIANKLKDEFLTNVSHELRTPLNGMLGMTDLLLDTGLDEEQLDFALTSKKSALDLLSLVDGILNFSQLQTGNFRLHPEPFDIHDVVAQAAALVKSKADCKALTVDVQIEGDVCALYGDKARIRQILDVFCDNAIKFTDRGSLKIAANCSPVEHGMGLRLSVTDTGIGIAPEHLGFIFERFTQADGSLTRARGGTGLGLAIVKEMASALGGQVGVNSQIGEGSEFWFEVELPLDSSFAGQKTTPDSGGVLC
jgi:signal transduction histidine kinase